MADAAHMTIAEFDKFVEGVADGRKYELFDGAPVLMSNSNETHEQIVGNIAAPLKLAMDRRGCRTYMGGMMVQATASSAGRHKFRPDIVVRSGPPSNNSFITDPVVVVEVLSPSTMDRDRGRKLQFYKELRRCSTSCWPMPTRCGSSTISGPRMDRSSVAAEVKGADIF
jgi:Uma2 family endonuclease